jgi:hypothetical protein
VATVPVIRGHANAEAGLVTHDDTPGVLWRVVADTFEQLVDLLALSGHTDGVQ